MKLIFKPLDRGVMMSPLTGGEKECSMLFDEGGKQERTVPHRIQFENQREQLDGLSALVTADRHTYFTAIRDSIHDLMDANDWINSSHEWKDDLHKPVYDCLGDGHDEAQWNSSRMFFGLLLRHVINHTGEEQEWEIIPKGSKRSRINEDPEGTIYHCRLRRGPVRRDRCDHE